MRPLSQEGPPVIARALRACAGQSGRASAAVAPAAAPASLTVLMTVEPPGCAAVKASAIAALCNGRPTPSP